LIAAADGRIRRVVSALPGFSFADNILLPARDGSEVYVFNGAGRHLRTVDAFTGGVRYQFGYDAAGYPVSVTDGSNNVTTIERTGTIPTAIVAPGGQRTALVVNGDGWLTGATNPAGEARTMVSTADGLLQQFTNPRGGTYRFAYDALGQLIKDEDPAGGSTSLNRTTQPSGYTVTISSSLGRTHTYQIEQLTTGALRRTTTEPSGTKTVELTNTDGTEQATYATGSVVTVQYGADPRWGMLAPFAASWVVTTPGGRTRTVTTARTATLTDPANPFSLTRLTNTITDNGKVTRSVYDATPRLFTITSPAGRIGKLNIDSLGRSTREQIAALAPIDIAYNSQGLLSTIVAGSATPRTASFTYDAARQLTDIGDPIGRSTNFAYDSAQRPLTQTLPDGRIVGLGYDGNGNVTSVTPPGRPAHAFSYNAVDLETQYNPPNVAGVSPDETAISYNPDRQPVLRSRPDGRTIVPAYDNAGRASSVAFSRGSLGVTYAPTSGLPIALSAPGGIGHAFTYDGGLLLSHALSGPISGTVSWTYDNDFRVVSQSVNGANLVNFTYNVDSLLTRAGAMVLTRDPANGLLTGTTLNTVTDTFTYNVHAEPLDYRAKVGATDLYRTQFTRDALGRIAQKIETIQGVTDTYVYNYDIGGRLIGVVKNGVINTAYTYDPNSNRTSYTGPLGTIVPAQVNIDAQDRTSKYGANTYTFDAHGDITAKIDSSGTTTYTYDEFGNLTQVVLPTGTVIDYVIDAMNRRIGKKVNGTLVRQWLWEGRLRIVAELDGAGSPISRFVYATRVNVPEYLTKSGTTYRIITDQLGSPRLVINTVTGAVAQRIDYDEFGRALNDTNPGFQPFGFAGGVYDPDTRLVRFGARDYDAEIGRWTTKDPVHFRSGDANMYGYLRSDPLNSIDALGLVGIAIGGQGNLLGGTVGLEAGMGIYVGTEGIYMFEYGGPGLGVGISAGVSGTFALIWDLENFWGHATEYGINLPIGGISICQSTPPGSIIGPGPVTSVQISVGPSFGGDAHAMVTETTNVGEFHPFEFLLRNVSNIFGYGF
jgi:RHS repeat-associated protein